jgi:hypothetical protein
MKENSLRVFTGLIKIGERRLNDGINCKLITCVSVLPTNSQCRLRQQTYLEVLLQVAETISIRATLPNGELT